MIYLLALKILSASFAFATSLGEAPDALSEGPYKGTNSIEYKLPAETDPFVLPDRITELWARVTWPTQKTTKSPLVIFLHGNHATCGTGSNPRMDNNCEYSRTGTCPSTHVVVPNHAGYQYLADHLARWGMIVVSINANRGINCAGGFEKDNGLNLARGRLVLSHLSALTEWPKSTPPPQALPAIVRKISWDQVGLMGHSRGGEGMRAALMYLKRPEQLPFPKPLPKHLRVRSLYEIGAVDGQSSVVLNPDDVTWNQLLPMCDGDVSSLSGRLPFERLLRSTAENDSSQKSLFYVWGANHNFFNTEWQVSDSMGCKDHTAIFPPSMGSPSQTIIATQSITSFFLASLFDDQKTKVWARNFNPLFTQTETLKKITPFQQEFYVAPTHLDSVLFEDFSQPSGKNTRGHANQAAFCKVEHKLLTSKTSPSGLMHGAEMSWPAANAARARSIGPTEAPYYQMNAAAPKDGWNISSFQALEFRVSQLSRESLPPQEVSFSVALLDAQERISDLIPVSDFQKIMGPVHTQTLFYGFRIPLFQMKGIDLSQVRAVRFVFDQSPQGQLLFSNVRISKSLGEGVIGSPTALSQRRTPAFRPPMYRQLKVQLLPKVMKRNRIVSLQNSEIEIETADEFPALNELPVLHIGKLKLFSSRYTEGHLRKMAFRVSNAEIAALPNGAQVQLTYGIQNPNLIFLFGSLSKSQLIQKASKSQ